MASPIELAPTSENSSVVTGMPRCCKDQRLVLDSADQADRLLLEHRHQLGGAIDAQEAHGVRPAIFWLRSAAGNTTSPASPVVAAMVWPCSPLKSVMPLSRRTMTPLGLGP